ncbi:AAA family ATPase [Microcoleus sp.]|uniref:AAA family ATPase n=1 Tax=Microcoleus sp. TaxID=44472 RepID=UPI003523F989
MKRFLRETWELWYWAMFCPSRLQQRMNEWVPAEEKDGFGLRSDTHSSDILLLRPNFRLISQFVLLIFLFSLPLIWGIALHGQAIDLLLVFGAIATAYSIGILCLSIGFHIPLLVYFIYPVNPQIYLITLDKVQSILPPYWYFALTATGLIGLVISTWSYTVARMSDEVKRTNSLRMIVLIVVGIVVAIVVTIVVTIVVSTIVQSTQQTIVAVVVGLFVGAVVGSVMGAAVRLFVGAVVGLFVGAAVGLFVGFFIGSIVTVIMGGIVAIVIATLPLPLFLLICWLIATSLSPTMQNWLAIITAVTLTTLGFEHLNWMSFLAVPVTLISYYRLADYLILTLIDLLLSILLIKPFQQNPVRLLHLLPPYTTELVWIPLLNHDRILAAAFRTDASATLATFQKMQASPLPGLKVTIKEALPQIITDQLTVIENIYKLIAIATPEHPFLPLLAPTFYQTESVEIDKQIIQTVSSSNNSLFRIWFIFTSALGSIITGVILIVSTQLIETIIGSIIGSVMAGILTSYFADKWSFDIEDGTDINKLLPRLQTVAKDVDAALKAGNIGIRKRALEPILTYLLRLQLQLPELGLTTRAIKRWQPVLVRWQRLIELEFEEQKKQSQDELLNPFQYGNPLRSDRANLFRGRQTFADEIVRLILDRNRPTLVLHGPRRCGKTSFLYNLPRLLPSSLLPVYLDLQSSAITTDEAAFCQGLVRAIHRDSRSQGIELPITPTRQEFLETPYIVLEDWLEQALPRLGERRLLLNLDEFEKIGIAIKEKRLSLKLFDELRHLIQHYDSLAFLFSGVQTLDELGPNWSSYFISVVPLEMTYLEPDEAESLLTNPDPEFALHYDRGIVDDIIQLTRCQPYLLQLLGSALVTQANLNHTQLVTPDLLQAAIPEAFTNGEPYFTNVWTEFTGNNPAEVIAGQEFLLELANGLAPGHSQDLTDAAIRRLRRYHAIEQTDNGYVFEVPLLERWVRERAVKNSNY